MKAQFQKILNTKGSSFYAKKLNLPRFHDIYHFHPEYELKYVIKSRGKRFVGNTIETFNKGDLVLLGPNIPHYWKNDTCFEKTNHLNARAIIILFLEDFFGKDFFLLPEMLAIKKLLLRAKEGLCFANINQSYVPRKMNQILVSDGPKRIILMIEILFELAKLESRSLITPKFMSGMPVMNNDEHSILRLQKVHDFVINNFDKQIKLKDIAAIANMTNHSFCKYFLRHTQKTFITFLTELRICHAKKLLIENDSSISQISYDSGFNNLSNFNRRFKELTKMTPKEFRSMYMV